MAYPTVNVNTTNLDASADSPAAARADLLDLAQKFNGLRPLPADLAASTGAGLVGGAAWYAATVTGFNAALVPDGATVIFRGRGTTNDGGGGAFIYAKTGTQTSDSGLVFAPTGGGRLLRNGWTVIGFNGPLNPLWFGVIGNNSADDTAAYAATIASSIAAKATIEVPGGLIMRITSTLDLPPATRMVGTGGAVQFAPRFISVGGINIFTARSGYNSESAAFENLAFDSETAGTGAAFYGSSTSYISQATFKNVTFYSNLQFGINSPIILCSFFDCDFGSYPGALQNFTAINSVGTTGTFEPNANCFWKCTFRKSNSFYQINVATGGTQWNFYNCDFEQNACTQCIIRYDAAGAVSFYSGYIESNATPYFLRVYGSLAIAFCQVVRLHGVHINRPTTIAIIKRELAYPFFDIQGCYGLLDCNVAQNEQGVFNSPSDIENCHGNHFVAGTGSFGQLDTVVVNGYTNRRLQVSSFYADTVNGAKVLSVSVTTTKAIATLSNPLSSTAFSYGGQVTITALSGSILDAVGEVNTATYVVLINRGGITSCTLISSNGVTAGAAAAHPSFTWTLSGNSLQATPVGSTSGVFSFLISCSGMIKAS